ncbi:MAG: helix-turn-helix domain-containing protein [Limisphaerales bacterium]
MDHIGKKAAFFNSLAPNDQFLALFDLIPEVSFFVKDRNGRFMALSIHKHEHCGVKTEADAIGKTDHDFFSKPRADAYRADDLAVMESGKPVVNRVEASPEVFDSPRLVATSKIPLRNRSGKIVGVAGLSRPLDEISGDTDLGRRFEKVIKYIHGRYGDPITSKELAAIAGLSVSQFERRFGESFGASPRQYLLRIRIEAAARLLASTEQTVSEIAIACGFHDHAHFSKSFRKMMHMSPTRHRAANRLQPSD